MKTIKQLLITIAVLLCSATMYAYDFEVDGIYYNIISSEDLTVEVTSVPYYYDVDYSGEVVIPSTVNYNGEVYSVTSIGEYAFSICSSSLISIEIPNSVTTIGNFAFFECSSLISIEIPNSVTSIGFAAFYDCSSLTSIEIPNSVTSIGNGTFYECSSLTSIEIPNSVTSIGTSVFEGCSSLISIEIPNSVTSIGTSVFERCSSLISIEIPNSVTSIGDGAFYECSSLTSVVFGENSQLTFIGSSAFYGCLSLTSIEIPNTVTSIEDYIFYDCSSLTSIKIPNSATSIGEDAFANCISLTSISIPESVTIIEDNAFYNCMSVKDLCIEDGNTTLELGYSTNGNNGLFYYCPLETVYLGRNLSYESRPFSGKNSLYSVVIGSEVTQIGTSLFSGCSNIHSLTISSGVMSIGYHAFSTPDKVIWLTNTPPEGYTNAEGNINYVANDLHTYLDNTYVYPHLSSIFEVDGVKYVPVSPSERTCHAIDCVYDEINGVINIGESISFQGVDMNVTEVMPYTFYSNNYVKDVSVSYSGNLGEKAFYNCDSLEIVTISNHGNIGNEAFYNCDDLEIVTISNHGNIGNEAFYDCLSLNSITLGDNVSLLGDKAFYQCISLQEIVIPESVDTIGVSCFSGCYSLSNVNLGQSVNVINDNAFEGCSSIFQISIPKSVTNIENNVFKGCTALADVIIEDRNEILNLGSNGSSALFADCPLDSLYIGGKIIYESTSNYGYSPFYRNTSLRTVAITNKEDQIYDNEFYGCTNLKNVTIGHGVETIGNHAFSGCSNLDGFSFGSNLKTIGMEAFSDCINITSITSYAQEPPICGDQALDDINKWTCVLKIPQNYASVYQTADQWKEFFYIEDVVEIELFTITYIVDGEVYATESLTVGSQIIPEDEPEKEGYTFSGWSEIPETMPAEDITITGSFSINSYDLVYMVDDEEYKRITLEFGTEIIPEEGPTKEGYTFSGWSEIPETMPAEDITVTGSFSINSYDLVYIVDGEEYKRMTLEFGSEIIPEEEPEKEGYTFSGWSEVPETMPAHDVEVTGSFIPMNVSEITAEILLKINGNNISFSNADNSTIAIYNINGVLVNKIDKYTGEDISLDKGVYIVCVGNKTMKIKL